MDETMNNNEEANVTEESSGITEGGSATSDSTDGNSSQDSNQSEASGEGDIEQIESIEQNGKKYVSAEKYEELKKGFEARVGALTAKSKQATELLDTIRTNPEVRERFMQELGVQSKNDSKEVSEEDASESSSESQGNDIFSWDNSEKWLSSIQDATHNSFYRGQLQAVVSDVQNVVSSMMKKFEKQLRTEITPVKRYIGETAVKTFAEKNRDFDKYRDQVSKLMNESGMTIDQAYKVAKYEDLMKNLASKQGNQANQKKSMPPVAGRQIARTGSMKSNKMSLDDAIREAARETGWTTKK